MDFKVSYLDAGLPNSYFSDSDQLLSTTPAATQHTASTTPSRVNRRYKTQLRDFLSTCRTKRKLSHSSSNGQVTPPTNPTASATVVSPMPAVDYITDGCTAYNMYSTPYPTATADHTLSPYMGHSNLQHSFYPTPTALDNRYLAATTENLFHQYRPLSTYYPDYHHTTSPSPYGNGFLDMTSRTAVPTYDHTPATPNHHTTYRATVMPVDDKLYSCQQVVDNSPTAKYPTYVDSSRGYVVTNPSKCIDVSWPYSVSPSSGIIQPVQVMSTQIDLGHKNCAKLPKHPEVISNHSSPLNNGLITPKIEEIKNDAHMAQQSSVPPQHFSPVSTTSVHEMPRQTVLMWGSNHIHHNSPVTTRTSPNQPEYAPPTIAGSCDALKNLTEINNPDMCKWNGQPEKGDSVVQSGNPDSPHQQHHSSHHNHHNSRVVMVL